MTKETHNSYWDILKMEFHYAHGLYKTYERMSEEAQKKAEKDQESNPYMPANMPNMQSINSQINSVMSNLKVPNIPGLK